jgi:hypothetical protein
MKIGCDRLSRQSSILLSFFFLLFALGAGSARATTITSVGSGMWTNPAAWTPAQVPTPIDDVVIATGTTNMIATNSVTSIASLTIQPNGMLTHASNTTTAVGEKFKVVLSIANDLTIEAGGQINVDGRGYAYQQGPGPATGVGGAGHGGIGGTQVNPYQVGKTYGSIVSPTNFGSGGYYAGQNGGGAVQLIVGGTTLVHGTITASGNNNSGNFYYGSSGGSVFLTTAFLTGTGSISTRGAPITNASFSPGAGGRVAVVLTGSTSYGDIKLDAYSGKCPTGGKNGAGGTVYLEHTGHTPGQGVLVVDYGNIMPYMVGCITVQNGLAASSNMFSEIILTNGGMYGLDTNDVLTLPSETTIKGDPTNQNDGIWIGGTLNVPATFTTYSNYYIAAYLPNATFNCGPYLTLGSNAILRINAPFVLNCPLTIAAGGLVDHSKNEGVELYKIDLTVMGDLVIQKGGAINVDGRGYAAQYGPGKFIAGNGGGSHGGTGGGRYSADIGGLTTYGSITSPTNLGSGGSYYNVDPKSDGGGAVRLTVNGATTVNGAISANAREAYYSGSGGSVFLTTGTLTGNGTISASASTNYTLGLGGGGRIALILTNSSDFGQITNSARPAVHTATPVTGGGAGTIYFQTKDQALGEGTLLIDGANRTPMGYTRLSSNMPPTTVGTVVITNKAILELATNQSMTVNGSWSNRSVFVARTNSTVTFAGVNTTTITGGTNTFFNFICTNAVKTVEFAAGTTNTVLGLLSLGGEATFKSTIEGSQWYLILAPEGTQQIAIVRVKDSNAGSGQPLMPARKSTDLGNNLNWLFIKSSGAVILVR